MRSGISFTLSAGDRQRLRAVVADPKSPQKHVWRAHIVLLSGEGLGTSAIMTETGKSKTCVWRWQERFMHEGVGGLLRDKSRPPGKAPVPLDRVAEIVRLTQQPPPFEATHWTLRAIARAAGIAASTVRRRGRAGHKYCRRQHRLVWTQYSPISALNQNTEPDSDRADHAPDSANVNRDGFRSTYMS